MPIRRFLLLSLSLAVVHFTTPRLLAADAGDPSELFLGAYMSVQLGEKFEHDGNLKQSLAKYRSAARDLDQLGKKYPSWQPLIVEYRKKRTAENISRVEQRLGPGAAAAVGDGSSDAGSEVPLPQQDSAPTFSTSTSGGNVAPPSDGMSGMNASASVNTGAGAGDDVDIATSQIRNRIQQLQSELRDSRAQLQAVQQEKEDMAGRLDSALKQLDKIKVNDAELKAQLKQAEEAFKNAVADGQQNTAGNKELQDRIAGLQEALRQARDERDAIEQENSDYSRRISKTRETAQTAVKERDEAKQQVTTLKSQFADASKLSEQLETAKKQIASLTQERDAAKQHASELDGKLADASKLAAQLDDAKKQIATLQLSDNGVSAKLADAQKQVQALTGERDAMRKSIDDLNGKLATAQNQIAAVSAERDQMAKQRDQALADLAKVRAAQGQVDKLLTDNAALSQKLADAEKTIQQFNVEMPKKDEQIASLKKEMSDTKEMLASAQRQNQEFQATMADLQQQLDSASSELANVKASGVSSDEKRKLTDENDLLRGIVLRQLKEQARRTQAKKLVIDELDKLQVQSDTVLKQIDYLSQPVVKLTDQEKALFKQPQLEIADADNTMEFSIAAPKQESTADPQAAASPATKPSDAANNSPAPAPAASATPVEVASLGSPDLSGKKSPPAADSALPSKEGGQSSQAGQGGTSPQVETQAVPGVPDEMVPQAREAKDFFERGQYRESEKTYEKMLAKTPNNVYVLSNLGVVRFREGKMKLAEEAFKKAIALAPNDTFSHCTLGIVYYQQAKFDEAVAELTKALAINPKYAVAHNYLGITASQKGWQEAALKELETAIALDPNYADANFNLSVIYATQQPPNKEFARKYYKRATDLGAEPDATLEQMLK